MAGRAELGGGYKEIVSGGEPAQIMRAPLNIGSDLGGQAPILSPFHFKIGACFEVCIPVDLGRPVSGLSQLPIRT